MLLIKTNHRIYTLVIFFITIGAVLTAAPSKIENLYKKRLLGDEAYNQGLYDIAVNYYKQYIENAGVDTDAVRDSYYCLIATCLKASNIKEAELFFNKLSETNKDYYHKHSLAEQKLNYWHGEILLTKGLNEEAEKIFTQVIKNTKTKDKNTYIQASIGLGNALIRQAHWESAKTAFNNALSSAETSEDKIKATEQLVLLDLITGDTNAAKEMINKLPDSNNSDLLSIFTLIKAGQINDAEQKYLKLSPKLTSKSNTITYLITSELANYYIKSKGYKKALDKLQIAFSKAPNLFEKESIAILTINTLIESENYKEAASSAKMFLNFFPPSQLRDKILLVYLEILIKLKTPPENIIETVNKYYHLKDNPYKVQVDIAVQIGKVFYKLKDFKNASIYFHYCYKNGTTRYQCGEGIYWYSKCLLAEGHNTKALNELKKIDSKIPEWEDKAMLEISLIFITEKEYINAKEELKLLMKKYPNSKSLTPPPEFLYAVALSGNNEYKLAIEQYISFAEKYKDNSLAPDSYCKAGDLCLRIADFDKAIKCYQQILDSYPKSKIIPEILYKLLYSYYLSGGYNKAIEVVNDLNKKYPQNDYALQASFWLVDYYTENKNYANALKQLDIISNVEKNNVESLNKILYEKADILSKMEQYDSAIDILDKIISESKDNNLNAKSYFLKGDINSQTGKFDEAIEAYKSVLTVSKDNDLGISAQGRIGDCYFAVINFADDKIEAIKLAIKAYQEIFSYSKVSKFITIQTDYKLGRCYELLGDKKNAIIHFHEALYENVLDLEEGVYADREWMGKAGVALANILLEENTKESALSTIKVYQTLIKNKVQPEDSFRKSIKDIKLKYKIEE